MLGTGGRGEHERLALTYGFARRRACAVPCRYGSWKRRPMSILLVCLVVSLAALAVALYVLDRRRDRRGYGGSADPSLGMASVLHARPVC